MSEMIYFHGTWSSHERTLLARAVRLAEARWGHRLPGRRCRDAWVALCQEIGAGGQETGAGTGTWVYLLKRAGWTFVLEARSAEALARRVKTEATWRRVLRMESDARSPKGAAPKALTADGLDVKKANFEESEARPPRECRVRIVQRSFSRASRGEAKQDDTRVQIMRSGWEGKQRGAMARQARRVVR